MSDSRPTRLPALALAISLAPYLLAGLMFVVATLYPITNGRREPAAGFVLLGLTGGIVLAWGLGLGLSIYLRSGASKLDAGSSSVARAAFLVSVGSSVLMFLLCIGCMFFAWAFSLR